MTASTAKSRQQFRLQHPLRVRWAEVDMQKIVFNAHYLTYVDTAMSEYWRAMALPYETTLQSMQGDLYLNKVALEYHASARMDDRLVVALGCTRLGTSSLAFEGVVWRSDERLVSANLLYVFADPSTQRARPLPEPLRHTLLAFEAGEPMTSTQVGDWRLLGVEAELVRAQVFVKEQGIAPELEQDGLDEAATHAVVRNGLGVAVATGRLLRQANGMVRIGRLAVDRVLRGTGLGGLVLRALMGAAAEHGDRQVAVQAQQSAQRFYTRHGFRAVGQPFEEAGITHIEMLCPLSAQLEHPDRGVSSHQISASKG